jgi:hypothetical protein
MDVEISVIRYGRDLKKKFPYRHVKSMDMISQFEKKVETA